jgi:hypothetical protein
MKLIYWIDDVTNGLEIILMDSVRKALDESRCLAESLWFPPFVGPERESTPLNASPYVAHLADLRDGRFLSKRGPFVRQFTAAVDDFPGFGVRAVAALLGGSAIGPTADPSDLDAVIFYKSLEKRTPDAGGLLKYLKLCKARHLDLRAFPLDGDPIITLKAVSFFSMLYSKREGSLMIERGLVLIDCRDRP